MSNDGRGLAHLDILELTTSTSAPVSGDWRLFFDTSLGKWVKQDASTGDQIFDDVTIDGLTVSSTATFSGATIANLGTVSAATSITTAVLVVGTTASFTGSTTDDLGTVATAIFTDIVVGTGGATAAEIVRTCDLSTRVVALTGTTAITLALHADRDLYITGTSAATYTMPAPSGTGARYRFIMGEVNANATIITMADQANDNFIGHLMMLDADASVPVSAVSGDHNISLDGDGTTGGALGDYIELTDVATNVWAVHGSIFVLAGQSAATPFNAA